MRTGLIFLGILITGLFLIPARGFSQDPNFYIYLCFGQSNMEGQGKILEADRTVDSRFQVMAAMDCSNLARTKGTWYTAVPPLCRCYTRLSPADYFGRMMVANLPDSIRVGVINVSVAGCKIELFDRDNYQDYVSAITDEWLLNIINEYDGNPYGYLVDLATQAKADGVIKGILIHQGESNTGDINWPTKVKGVYENLIKDLGLDSDSIPLLAGEVVHADQGGICASMNSIIATLPDTIPNSYVISSSGCTDTTDNLHFNSAGYRELGIRYGETMLSVMGFDTSNLQYPEVPVDVRDTDEIYLEPECAWMGEDWDIVTDLVASHEKYVTVKAGTESIANVPVDSSAFIYIPFSVDTVGYYNLYAHLNCPTYEDDSFWIRMDEEGFVMFNGLATNGWEWKNLNEYPLTKGDHVLSIAYRENGALLDKICISNYTEAPTKIDDTAVNCENEPITGLFEPIGKSIGYSLSQNFPNPFLDKTNISFHLPDPAYVSLKVYDLLGNELAELAGKEYPPGKHSVEFNPVKISGGYYIYIIRTERFCATRKMIIANLK